MGKKEENFIIGEIEKVAKAVSERIDIIALKTFVMRYGKNWVLRNIK